MIRDRITQMMVVGRVDKMIECCIECNYWDKENKRRNTMRLKNVQGIVLNCLEDNEVLRDNDNKLVANIWYKHIKRTRDVTAMNALDLLVALGNNELPSWESITRCRRKIQEKRTDLRGNNYDKRQKHQKDVVKDIRNFRVRT